MRKKSEVRYKEDESSGLSRDEISRGQDDFGSLSGDLGDAFDGIGVDVINDSLTAMPEVVENSDLLTGVMGTQAKENVRILGSVNKSTGEELVYRESGTDRPLNFGETTPMGYNKNVEPTPMGVGALDNWQEASGGDFEQSKMSEKAHDSSLGSDKKGPMGSNELIKFDNTYSGATQQRRGQNVKTLAREIENRNNNINSESSAFGDQKVRDRGRSGSTVPDFGWGGQEDHRYTDNDGYGEAEEKFEEFGEEYGRKVENQSGGGHSRLGGPGRDHEREDVSSLGDIARAKYGVEGNEYGSGSGARGREGRKNFDPKGVRIENSAFGQKSRLGGRGEKNIRSMAGLGRQGHSRDSTSDRRENQREIGSDWTENDQHREDFDEERQRGFEDEYGEEMADRDSRAMSQYKQQRDRFGGYDNGRSRVEGVHFEEGTDDQNFGAVTEERTGEGLREPKGYEDGYPLGDRAVVGFGPSSGGGAEGRDAWAGEEVRGNDVEACCPDDHDWHEELGYRTGVDSKGKSWAEDVNMFLDRKKKSRMRGGMEELSKQEYRLREKREVERADNVRRYVETHTKSYNPLDLDGQPERRHVDWARSGARSVDDEGGECDPEREEWRRNQWKKVSAKSTRLPTPLRSTSAQPSSRSPRSRQKGCGLMSPNEQILRHTQQSWASDNDWERRTPMMAPRSTTKKGDHYDEGKPSSRNWGSRAASWEPGRDDGDQQLGLPEATSFVVSSHDSNKPDEGVMEKGVQMGRPLDREKRADDKKRERATLVANITKSLAGVAIPTEKEIARAAPVWIRQLERECADCFQFEAFWKLLPTRCSGRLLLHVKGILKGAEWGRAIGNDTDERGRILRYGISSQKKFYDANQRVATKKNDREVLPPDYIPCYRIFKELVLEQCDVARIWEEVARKSMLTEQLRMREDEGLRGYEVRIMEYREVWRRTPMQPLPLWHDALVFYLGMPEDVRVELREKHPQSCDPGRIEEWNLESMAGKALKISLDPKFCQMQEVRRKALNSSQSLGVHSVEGRSQGGGASGSGARSGNGRGQEGSRSGNSQSRDSGRAQTKRIQLRNGNWADMTQEAQDNHRARQRGFQSDWQRLKGPPVAGFDGKVVKDKNNNPVFCMLFNGPRTKNTTTGPMAGMTECGKPGHYATKCCDNKKLEDNLQKIDWVCVCGAKVWKSCPKRCYLCKKKREVADVKLSSSATANRVAAVKEEQLVAVEEVEQEGEEDFEAWSSGCNTVTVVVNQGMTMATKPILIQLTLFPKANDKLIYDTGCKVNVCGEDQAAEWESRGMAPHGREAKSLDILLVAAEGGNMGYRSDIKVTFRLSALRTVEIPFCVCKNVAPDFEGILGTIWQWKLRMNSMTSLLCVQARIWGEEFYWPYAPETVAALEGETQLPAEAEGEETVAAVESVDQMPVIQLPDEESGLSDDESETEEDRNRRQLRHVVEVEEEEESEEEEKGEEREVEEEEESEEEEEDPSLFTKEENRRREAGAKVLWLALRAGYKEKARARMKKRPVVTAKIINKVAVSLKGKDEVAMVDEVAGGEEEEEEWHDAEQLVEVQEVRFGEKVVQARTRVGPHALDIEDSEGKASASELCPLGKEAVHLISMAKTRSVRAEQGAVKPVKSVQKTWGELRAEDEVMAKLVEGGAFTWRDKEGKKKKRDRHQNQATGERKRGNGKKTKNKLNQSMTVNAVEEEEVTDEAVPKTKGSVKDYLYTVTPWKYFPQLMITLVVSAIGLAAGSEFEPRELLEVHALKVENETMQEVEMDELQEVALRVSSQNWGTSEASLWSSAQYEEGVQVQSEVGSWAGWESPAEWREEVVNAVEVNEADEEVVAGLQRSVWSAEVSNVFGEVVGLQVKSEETARTEVTPVNIVEVVEWQKLSLNELKEKVKALKKNTKVGIWESVRDRVTMLRNELMTSKHKFKQPQKRQAAVMFLTKMEAWVKGKEKEAAALAEGEVKTPVWTVRTRNSGRAALPKGLSDMRLTEYDDRVYNIVESVDTTLSSEGKPTLAEIAAIAAHEGLNLMGTTGTGGSSNTQLGSKVAERWKEAKDKAAKWSEYRDVAKEGTMFEKAGLGGNAWAEDPVNKKLLSEALEAYKSVFEAGPDGKLKRIVNADGTRYKVKLHLRDKTAVRSAVYRQPPAARKKIIEGVKEMLKLGVVRRELSAYGAQCLAIGKCDGSERIVTDFIRLNKQLEDVSHPSMTEFDVYHLLYGCNMFTKIDLTKFYWQISLDEDSQACTGFTVPGFGSFVYEVLPMGVKPACAIAQALAEDLFRLPYDGPGPMNGKIGLGNIIINWMDDLLCFSGLEEDGKCYHVHYVVWVLKILKSRNVQASLRKAHIGKERVGMIGHYLDKDGLHVDPEKCKAVAELPIPTDVASLRRLLGMAQYLSKFIEDFAEITAPLSDLLQAKCKWEMTEERRGAVKKLCEALTSPPVLMLPNFAKKFIVRCDASKTAMGVSISQVYDGIRKPVSFWSAKFRGSQLNYGVRDKECAAVRYGTEKAREYTQGSHYFLMTDHKNLLAMKNAKPTDMRMFNNALALSAENFTLIHTAGKFLYDADMLSRNALDDVDVDAGDVDVRELPSLGEKTILFPTEEEAVELVGRTAAEVKAHEGEGVTTTDVKVHAVRRKKQETSVHLVMYRKASTGDVEILVGKELVKGEDRRLSVPGGKLNQDEMARFVVDPKEALREAIIRIGREQCGLEIEKEELPVPQLREEKTDKTVFNKYVLEVWAEELTEVKFEEEGRGLNLVKWYPIVDVVAESKVNPTLSKVVAEYVRKQFLELRQEVMLPKEQPGTDGRYNIVAVDAGLCSEIQAVEGSSLKVIGVTGSNEKLLSYAKGRGAKNLGSTKEFVRKVKEGTWKGKHVHVLSVKCGVHPRPEVAGESSEWNTSEVGTQFVQAVTLVKGLSPTVVMIRAPCPDGNFRCYAELEGAFSNEGRLGHMGFEVRVDIYNAAEHGDYVARKEYVLIATKLVNGQQWFVPPQVRKKFRGVQDVLGRPGMVHPKLRAPIMEEIIPEESNVFEPQLVGKVVRNASPAELSGVFSLEHPLPAISHENVHGCYNGAQWVEDEVGPRQLSKEDMVKVCNFDSECRALLLNSTESDAQRYVASSTPIALMKTLLKSLLPVLEKQTAVENSPLGQSVLTNDDRVKQIVNVLAMCDEDVEFTGGFEGDLWLSEERVGMINSYSFPTLSEIDIEQGKEDEIVEVKKFLSATTKAKQKLRTPNGVYGGKSLKYMVLRNGMLFYRHELGKGEILTEAVVMPKSLQKQALRALHDSPLYGHPGSRATQFTVQSKCFWGPHQVKDIKKYMKKCLECGKAKIFRRTHAGTPRRQMYWKRNDMCCFDLIGPLVTTEGFKYIGHATNPCTGFNYSDPLVNKTTETVTNWMHKLFLRVGWPVRVLTDNGGEFCSELQDRLESEFGYMHIKCCPKSPKGNSWVEGRHKQMNAMLKICVKMYGKNWVQGLPYINWALNVRPFRDSEVTPYECEYGEVAPSMGDMSSEQLERDQLPDVRKFKSISDWNRTAKANRENAIMISAYARASMMKDNDAYNGSNTYVMIHEEGSFVLVNRPITKKGETSRLLYQCIGPFEVVGPACPASPDGSYNAYKLKCLATGKVSPFNVTDIHPYLEKGEKGNWEKEEGEEEEEKEDGLEWSEEELEGFDPQEGEFLLFPGFNNVPYHLIRVVDRPDSDTISFHYYGKPVKEKKASEYAKVWTHDTESKEMQSNQKVIKKGYRTVVHSIPIEDVCQKVIVPEEYRKKSKSFFRMTQSQVDGVLRYSAVQ